MKKLEAIINPIRLDETKESLIELGVKTLTATEVKAYSRSWSRKEIYRGSTYMDNSLVAVKLEVLLADHLLDDAVLILSKVLEPGMDEESIMVIPVEAVPEYLAFSRVY